MVARINTSKSISKTLNYNEQKVQAGKAELIGAVNFLKDAEYLNFRDKIWHFERLTSLNERAKTNILHVSLNFDPSETLDRETLLQIADRYMEGIGFKEQPYLIYQHQDAGHPHIHIVSTNIQYEGNRISMHNLGRNASEKTRKEIEKEFSLVKAEDKKNADVQKLLPVNASKMIYGKSETRRAIASVLGPVINQYRFSSLAEYNAVLKLYNITADRGKEDSAIYKNKGLTYHVLDDKGAKTGIPQKASAFFMKPTLNLLERKFRENIALKEPHKRHLAGRISWVLKDNPIDLNLFQTCLKKEGIDVVLRKNSDGLVYGITYVDHKTKCVFNGSELGKVYSAKAIFEQFKNAQIVEVRSDPAVTLKQDKFTQKRPDNSNENSSPAKADTASILEALITPERPENFIPQQLKRKRRKKSKKSRI